TLTIPASPSTVCPCHAASDSEHFTLSLHDALPISVNKTQPTSQIFVSIINICGCNTNIYGMINAAIASLDALAPVRMGSPPEIPVAANAANATGGVISATIPK